jgi:hypothetical protein
MDEPLQPPAPPHVPEDGGISRGKTIALWAGVAALLLALFGSLMIVMKSLQADRTLARISKSAGSTVAQASPPVPMPPPLAAPQAAPPQEPAGLSEPVPARAPVGAASQPHAAPAKPVRRPAPPPQAKAAVREPAPKAARMSVERRLAQCKEYAGEAAAACFRKACSTYAKRAPICVNDEPTARR